MSVRLSGVYGSVSRLATTPSSPAPSNSLNQRLATSASVVDGHRYTGGSAAASCSINSSWRSANGRSNNESSSSASRSKATNDAGVSSDNRRTRDSAG